MSNTNAINAKLSNLDEEIQLQESLNQDKSQPSLKIEEEIISQIENPYELILLLIEKANSMKEHKEDILSFKLLDIIDDFLLYTQQIQSMDIELTETFLLVVADLILLKSRSMLAVDNDDGEETREEQQRRILVATKEYEIFKNLTKQLIEREDPNKFEKEPDKSTNEYKVVIKPMPADILSKALNKMLERLATIQIQPAVQTISKDRWTVEDKIFEISTELINKNRLTFFDIIEEDYTKSEIINTFRAILELIKREDIAIQQEDDFDNIYIYKIATDEQLQEIFIDDIEE